jgi:MSHA biogenesis protein MshM
MYLQHYGLRELPFSLTPDTSFFFGYGHYRDAYNTLTVALQNGEGFIKVTGEVGTGKTLLCRKLLNSLGDDFVTAYIPNPYLTPSALIMAVADELGLEINSKEGPHRALKQITQRLLDLGNDGKKVVLCIDEAQAMPEQTMETLRLITNLETEKRKLLHVVLFGQPELDERLAQKSARQLRQRITFSYTLQPIDSDGIAAYLQHRLLVAGGNGEVSFDNDAVRQLYRGSGGFPRLINILAHKALMLGYGQGVKRIGGAQVKAAIADTEGAQQAHAGKEQTGIHPHALSAALALALLLVIGYQYLPVAVQSPLTPLPTAIAALTVAPVTPEVPPALPVTGEIAPVVIDTVVSINENPDPVTDISDTPLTPRLTSVSPARLSGSWEPQQLLVHGSALSADTSLIVSWDGREKLLPPERVEWLDSSTMRITLTTGVRSESWQLQLVQSDGQRSAAANFEVVAPNE